MIILCVHAWPVPMHAYAYRPGIRVGLWAAATAKFLCTYIKLNSAERMSAWCTMIMKQYNLSIIKYDST